METLKSDRQIHALEGNHSPTIVGESPNLLLQCTSSPTATIG